MKVENYKLRTDLGPLLLLEEGLLKLLELVLVAVSHGLHQLVRMLLVLAHLAVPVLLGRVEGGGVEGGGGRERGKGRGGRGRGRYHVVVLLAVIAVVVVVVVVRGVAAAAACRERL